MSLLFDRGLKITSIEERIVASVCFNMKSRNEILIKLNELKNDLPNELIDGKGFCKLNFISSYKEGYEVEVGYPISKKITSDKFSIKLMPALKTLTFKSKINLEKLNENYGRLYSGASELGIISDEFAFEIYYIDNENTEVELHFVIHDWESLFEKLIKSDKNHNTSDIFNRDDIKDKYSISERFERIKKSVEKIDELYDENSKYDLLSKCAHVFPPQQVKKLRDVFVKSKEEGKSGLDAVDSVLDFIKNDPGWGTTPIRKGFNLICKKQPANKKAYEEAKTDLERKKAYCFCPIIRDNIDKNMPATFCYCSAGWFRQQWEGATGKPVMVKVLKSLLKGDDYCEFEIVLSKNI